MSVLLRIAEGKGSGQEFVFSQDVIRVGRLPDNDLVLYDTGVSRYHCEIIRDDGGYSLHDVGSSNGTLHNGVLTTEGRLSEGDRIQVGPVSFFFEKADEQTEPSSAKRNLFKPLSDEKSRKVEEQKTSLAQRPSRFQRMAEGEQRTSTGSFLAYKGKTNFLGISAFAYLSIRSKIAILASVFMILGGAFGAWWIVTHKPKPDRSGEVFVADKENASLRFGSGTVDISTPDRVNLSFDFGGGRVTLVYSVAGIGSPMEVELFLNGETIGYAPTTSKKWRKGLRRILPRKLLQKGKNILTFDNTLTPEVEDKWAVGQVQFIEEPLPEPNLKKAQEFFDMGEVAFDTRSVAPQNLFRSIEYFDDALRFVEAAEPVLPIEEKIREAHARSEQELNNVFDSHLFSAQKALRFGDRKLAMENLRDAIRYFPDPEDLRRKRLKERAKEIIGNH
ncbi:FHA domain-containing protein [Myxococcota bacterium]|nr:FHA domain-containing protein [Myxococcota bacterium]